MKNKLLPLVWAFFGFVLPFNTHAQCESNMSEMIITVVPDGYPEEIGWSLYSGDFMTFYGEGTWNSDTFCVPSDQCLVFYYSDQFSDGIGDGHISVTINGIEVLYVTGAYSYESAYLNCPPGSSCSSAIVVAEGDYTAPNPEFWYQFTADSTGNYAFSTCETDNTCNTILYGYTNCPNFIDEGVYGVVFYNDDFCGTGSQVIYEMQAGQSVYVRIGDLLTDCAGQAVDWSVHYYGQIEGCTDTSACNYNPLAELENGSCWYPTETAPCEGPDLKPNAGYFETSMYLDNNHNAWTCEVEEGCLMGYGTRQMLKYGVEIMNVGNQSYWPGTPQNNPDSYEWASCHGHYHYTQFAESYLYDANFQQVDFARKTSYAIINMNCTNPANEPPLAAGCSDVYGAGYACQAVDVTDLDTGTYYLVLRLNATHKPDYVGRIETDYSNNATQVCLHLGLDLQGQKTFDILPNCVPYTDCMGVPLGMTQSDCAGDCGGTRIRGDLNVDTVRTIEDANMYMTKLADHTLSKVTCQELTNDTTYTVYDAARLNACVRYMNGEHEHIGGDGGGNHGHCNFPFGFYNMLDTVAFELANVTENGLDIYITNKQTYMLGYELQLSGVTITSVQNLVDNYNPSVQFNADGHIVSLAMDEFPLNKTFEGAVLHVTFEPNNSNVVCIDQIMDVVNTDYHRVIGTAGVCATISSNQEVLPVELSLFPNPAQEKVTVRLDGGMTQNASIQLIDLTGRILSTWSSNDQKNKMEIDISQIPEGVYIVSVEAQGFVSAKRLVIAR